MVSFDRERDAAVEAARLASQLCLAIRREMLQDMEHMEKAGREPVTIADYGAQAIILQHLAGQFPQDGSLAEERAAELDRLATEPQRGHIVRHVSQTLDRDVSLDDVRRWLDIGHDRETSRVWVVDPIDGTKGFLRGDQFAVAVALLVDGQVAVGALGCPLLPFEPGAAEAAGVIASAARSAGARIEPLAGGRSRPMRVSDRSGTSGARSVESLEHGDLDFTARVLSAAGIREEPVRMDSQAKYVAVGDGRAEAYIRLSRGAGYTENVWDHAAGVLIVEEAGGTVTDLDGKPMDFTHGAKLAGNRGILATNGEDSRCAAGGHRCRIAAGVTSPPASPRP